MSYSFRRMAQDGVEVVQHLGFNQFCVAGHDRGGRTAIRMALDEYARCCTPESIHAVWEDYRANVSVDFEMDKAGHRHASACDV